MAFTPEEETILKLMVNELRTRVRLDAKRTTISDEIRAATNPINAEIRSNHSETLSSLQTDFNNAETALRQQVS